MASAPPPSILPKPHAPTGSLVALAFGALGVVFGDIGTSPLYTLQVGIAPEPGTQPHAGDVLGVCSLIVWALTMVVTVKYLAFVMRADNHGEGGILALLALVPESKKRVRRRLRGTSVPAEGSGRVCETGSDGGAKGF